MGATASSAQRDSRCEEDTAVEELPAAESDARDDAGADNKLLQKNGQISSLNVKTSNHADELNGNFEERVLADVGSGFVTLKEDGTETIEDIQEMDALQPVMKNESTEMVDADSVTVKEETEEDDISEVGFKKIFRFVGFKFTLKKDTCENTESDGQAEKVTSPSEDSSDTQENSTVAANENTPAETREIEVSSQPDAAEPSQQTDNEKELDQDIKIVEHHVEDTPEKELEKEGSPELEEPISPIKQFFTQGIFASLRKKKKEEEMLKESKEDEIKRIERMGLEEAKKEDSKCICLDIPHITSEEEKDTQEKDNDTLLPEGEFQNSLEKDKVQGSPLKRLFRKFSTKRQRESKSAEKVIEAEEQVSEHPKPSLELTELAEVEEPVVGEPKPDEEELVANVSPQETKKKPDTTASWEALICGGSAKKRARKTNEDETPEKREVYEKATDSPLGSSTEGDYDHLTSSNEQSGSPAEEEMGSTWKTLKKMVIQKRKVRTGENSTPEQIPSDSEMNKDEPFTMKKLIPGHKKRKSDESKDQTSSDGAAKDHKTGDEDDETPAIIPLSEYEIIEPESLKELHEQQVEITIEHEMPEMASPVLEQDTSDNLLPKVAATVPINTGPTVICGLPEDFEELTDFLSKHQQLSDIPEEGIIEESIETPKSSAEWTTQDDTLAEDIVELTADAVTAPEPSSEQFIGDDTTEMVSAVSQLTNSPRSSGHFTPVSAEYGLQTPDVILQEAIQSICMTPSVQSVTTKDESQESLAISFSPYIVQSSTTEETKVLVAHKKTEATAICTGLESQEIESVEEHLPAPLVEVIPEVSDAVPTELVSDNFKNETEVAGLWTDEVYEAEIKKLKTEYQELIVSEKESATETELSVEQVIPLVAEPLVGESEETHMEKQREECTTSIELRQVIETMQSEAGLEQVMSDYTHDPETECPLHSVLEEPVYEQPVAAEPEKDLTLSDVKLFVAEYDQPASTELVETSTQGDTDISKEVKEIEINASAVECLEVTATDSIISPIPDHIQAETLGLEGSLKLEAAESMQVEACEIQFDIKDAVLLAGDSAVAVEDISGKIQEKDYEQTAQQDIKEIHVEEETGDDVASEAVKNISEAGDESLAREQLPAKGVSLPEPVLVEETEEHQKEDTKMHLDDKVEDGTDGIFVKEEEEHAVKEGQPLTNTGSNETPIYESPEIIVDPGSEIGEMVYKIREHTVVSAFSKDLSEHTETPELPHTRSEVIQIPLEIVLPEVEAEPVAPEIAQPATTENIKTGKVLEMVAIIENTTKQSGKEKPMVPEPVTQVLSKSKLPKATEQEGEEIDGDQSPAMTSSEMKEIAVPEEKDTMAVAPKPEPEGVDSEMTMIKIPTITVLAQNYTAAETEVSNMSEKENEEDENASLKCESLEQVTEKILSNELHVDKTEIKDEIPAVIEITTIAQESPLTSEVTAKTPEVAVSEIQSEVVSELRAETLEVREPKVEIPVVSEVKVETAVVAELEVETPVVTSVAKELELETLVVTSMAKTTDTNNSAVTSQNQNIDSDTSVLTTVIKEQVVEIPTVISVVVTPATPLDELTPVVTLGNGSKDVPPVKETPVETLNVESVIVKTAVSPVVEIQNVIPVVATPDLGSVIVTEAASPVVSTGTVTTKIEETPVLSTVVETPVFSVTEVKSTPATVEKTVVSPVLQIPATVTSFVETPAVDSVKETVPLEEVTLDVTSFAETHVSQVIETLIVSVTSVKPTVVEMAKTPDTEMPAMSSMTVAEAVSPVVGTSSGTPVASETIMIPEVKTSVVTSAAETSLVTPAVETPAQISVIATNAAPPVTPAATAASETSEAVETAIVESPPVAVVETPVVTQVVETLGKVLVMVTETVPLVDVSEETAAVETPVEFPVLQTSVVNSAPVAEDKTPLVTPVVQTSGQVSVIVTESAPPVDVSAVTSAVETPVVIPVVETPILNSAPVAVDQTPVVTPVVQTPGQVSVMVTETAPPVNVSVLTAAVETPVVIPLVETSIVKSNPVAVVETPVVTPVVQTPGKVSVMVTEPAPPVVVSVVTAAVEAPLLIPEVETPIVKSTPVAVVKTPVVTPVVQTSCQVSEKVTDTIPPVVVSAVTATVETPVKIPLVEAPVVKSTPVAVVETPVVTPVVQTSCQVSEKVTDTTPPVFVSAVTATVETPVMIPVVEAPVLKSTPVALVETPVVQTSGQVSEKVTDTTPPVVVSAVTATVETPVMIPVVEAPVLKSTPVALVETPVVTQVVQTPGQVLVAVTDTTPPVVVSAVTATVETPVMIPVVESPVVKSTPAAVVNTPVVTPVVQTSGQVSEKVTDTIPPVVVSAATATVETPVMIPVVEVPVVKSTAVAVVETPVVTPAVQTPGKVSEKATYTTPPVVVSAVTATVETPVMIPVVEAPVVKSTPVAVVETPVVTPVVQTPGQVSEKVTDTTPPVFVSAVTATVETPVTIPVVEAPVLKSTPVALVETPVVTPVVQTSGQVSEKVTDTIPPVVVSAATATVETHVMIPVVEVPVVKSTAVAVVETPVVTQVVQTPGQVLVAVTDTTPPVVVSAVTATVETPVMIPVVESPVVKSTPAAVVNTPVVTPVVQTSGQVSEKVTDTIPPVVVSAATATVETHVMIPVVEVPVVKSTAVAVVETPVVTPAVQTPGKVSEKATDTTPPVVVSAVTATVETPVMIPVVEAPFVKSTPVAVVETPVVYPVVQTPGQVLVAVTEATPPAVVSAVTAAAETPVVISVVERSVVSLVLETTTEAPTAIAMAERPVMIPVVQTPVLVSVIAKEAAPPVFLPAVTAGPEVETPVSVPEAPAVILAVQTPMKEQVAQTRTTPAMVLVKATSVVTGMEAPTVTGTPLSHGVMGPAVATVIVATAPPVATPEVKKTMLQVVEQEKREAKSEASVVSKDVEPPFVAAKEVKISVLTQECISDEENGKASLRHTSTEPQSEVEEDVWEDAVDNIGDSPCQVTYTEDAPQDTAAKQTSDAAI
ncbi:mucin-17 isoform X4 [Carassius gibelio]|uniref:mucin-17 isoform X4 n=1 Tax=Carassius gibelio TaxID=101364 RepID=UPI002279918D|nr:mucin-17 isoform X4 [Carassius gibelio]